MKNIKLFTATLICISLFYPKGIVQAEEIINNTESVSVDFETSEQIAERLSLSNEYGKVIAKEPIQLGQQSLELYVEFENPKDALSNFAKPFENILSFLKIEYNLDEVSIDNFDIYYYCFLESLSNENTPYKNDYRTEKAFRSFYDIFENTASNHEIIQAVNKLNESSDLMTISTQSDSNFDEKLLNLALLLPYYDNFAVQANNHLLNSRSNIVSTYALSGTSLQKAINYATKYAINANYSYGYFVNADCTNFASQILEASGKSQIVTNYESSGWWHKSKITMGTGTEPDSITHSYSNSWIRADTFAKYWGTSGGIYTSVQTLSSNLRAGDFIAQDDNGDGDYNHIGFVTAVNSSVGIFTSNDGVTRSYKDFKVAQHTTNYHAYAHEDINHWEQFSVVSGTKVAIVGR